MRIPRKPFEIIRAELRPYLALNAIIHGSLLAGMATGMLFPDLTAAQIDSLVESGTAAQIEALAEGNVWVFGLVILGLNTLRVGLLSIIAPSLIVPFTGIVLVTVQLFFTGLIIAPVDADAATILIPHSVTLLIEFQAYVLLAFGVYLLGRSWLRPATADAPNRRQGYVRGLRQLLWLSALALALLVIGGFYEALSVGYLMPMLGLG